jgi:hypothetical protein
MNMSAMLVKRIKVEMGKACPLENMKQEKHAMTDNKPKTPKSSIKRLSKGHRKFVRRQKQAARKLGSGRVG